MKFTKMHGCGNDFVVINAFDGYPKDIPELSRRVCKRNFGVGADGLVLAVPSDIADFKMRFFNPDGSEAEMCGNAIRCISNYVRDENIVRKDFLKIETLAGILYTQKAGDEVKVDMGEPVLNGKDIPVDINKEKIIKEKLLIDDKEFEITCVSMGNPHCVIFVPEITDELVLSYGPKVEKNNLFPNKTNTEFIKVISKSEIDMRVYERGAGETLACGTGACASVVSGVLAGYTSRKCKVHLLGGDLFIDWQEDNNHVFMTGPAVTVFRGQLTI